MAQVNLKLTRTEKLRVVVPLGGGSVNVQNDQLYLNGRQDFISKICHMNFDDVSIGLH